MGVMMADAGAADASRTNKTVSKHSANGINSWAAGRRKTRPEYTTGFISLMVQVLPQKSIIFCQAFDGGDARTLRAIGSCSLSGAMKYRLRNFAELDPRIFPEVLGHEDCGHTY